MKFAIRIEEIVGKTVIVDAENLEEAIEKVENAVSSCKLYLNGVDDIFDRRISASEVFTDGIVPEGRDVSAYEHYTEDDK